MKRANRQQGFTLVEVLLSLFIICLFIMGCGQAMTFTLLTKQQTVRHHQLVMQSKSQLDQFLAGNSLETGMETVPLNEEETIHRIYVTSECEKTGNQYQLIHTSYLGEKPWSQATYYWADDWVMDDV